MPKKFEQFYKRNRFLKLYRFLSPLKKKIFLMKFRAAVKITKFVEPLFFKEIKMSKMINIKGKDISEDTIVEALKKHCGFTDKPLLRAGDIVKNAGGVRIIVEADAGGKLLAYNVCGKVQSVEGDIRAWSEYEKIGTLSNFFNRHII